MNDDAPTATHPASNQTRLTHLLERGRLSLAGIDGETIDIDLTLPYRRRDVLIEAYWRFHPRYLFFKSLPERARLADLGAGSGSLTFWKSWGEPERADLRMYAADLVKGEFFERYLDFDLVDLGRQTTKFPSGVFDAVIVSHVIDHVANRVALAREAARIARPGATIFVEWSRPESHRVVDRATFAASGIRCGPINFFDDESHVEPVEDVATTATFEAAGLRRVAGGQIANDYLFPELVRCGLAEGEEEATTYGLWLAYRLARYAVFEKQLA